MRPSLVLVALAAIACAPGAHAANAECTFRADYAAETEVFACEFETIDSSGSFNATGNGYFIQMDIHRRGRANGNMSVGGPTFDLGPFVRETKDRACWLNEGNGARVCAY